MSTVEPAAAIAIIENDLRALVRTVATGRNVDLVRRVLGDDGLATLEARRTEESKRRSAAVVPQDLYAYTQLHQLSEVILKNWDFFTAALGKKREFEVLIGYALDFRNAPAHSRELLPHERVLLEGIAGTLRTLVTKFMSEQSPDAAYYPQIEIVTDSFGNSASTRGPVAPPTHTGLRLQVGQLVEFQCRGWDPQGRMLKWILRRHATETEPATASGSETRLAWEVSDRDVGINAFIEIDLASDGEYHRHRGYDDRVTFHYSVDPPASWSASSRLAE